MAVVPRPLPELELGEGAGLGCGSGLGDGLGLGPVATSVGGGVPTEGNGVAKAIVVGEGGVKTKAGGDGLAASPGVGVEPLSRPPAAARTVAMIATFSRPRASTRRARWPAVRFTLDGSPTGATPPELRAESLRADGTIVCPASGPSG